MIEHDPLRVGCDTCGADPGQPCTTNVGDRPTRPHKARCDLAAKAGGARLAQEVAG